MRRTIPILAIAVSLAVLAGATAAAPTGASAVDQAVADQNETATTNYTVSGETPFAADTELQLVAAASGEFRKSASVTTDSSGAFSTTLAFEDDVNLSGPAEVRLTGDTGLEAGTELDVLAESAGDFRHSTSVTVAENGTVSVTVPVDNATYLSNAELDIDVQDETTTTTSGPHETSTTPSTTTASTTQSDGQPGFGVAVALLAVAGAALVVERD
ncbi:PGF-CTERM sorting domain-containing protein [Halomicrococcus gelatinilyticus]|uniref:PGF-CTERM sorting domain-containing protein n=1 Tax=Halomicrococcus gelatinilyticus TaxID=1702103 RepID=UPI002E0DE30C